MECHYFIRRNDLSDGSYADSRTCGSDRKRCTAGTSVKMIPILIVLLSGILSLFSDGTSVVMPLMIPIVVSLASATGINPAVLISCVCVPAIGMGMSPFSTGGGVFLSFVREDRFQKMMIQSLIAVLCNLGMMVALCAIGILR